MIHYSKKDAWLVVLVATSVIIPLMIGLYHFFAPSGNPQAGWTSLLVGISTGAVVLWLTYPLYYEITSSELKIRCGMLIRQEIPLSAIEEVYPTRNALSAPAWSLDRVRVNYRRGERRVFALISPEDQGSFMRELVKSGEGLEMRGERVIRVVS